MSGLNLGFGGGVKFGGAGSTIAQAPPASIAQVAYGGGSAEVAPSGVQYWHIGVGCGVTCTLLLWLIRYTLPG